MQPCLASVASLTGQSRLRGWLPAGLLAGAVVLATILPSAAVPLLPGDTVALAAGSSGAGTVKRDANLPFEVRDGSGQVVISGIVQDRVIKLDATGYLSFDPRLKSLVVGPAGAGYYILGLKLTGYDDTTTDVGFASSGSGTVGPSTASRDISGDDVTFQYASGALVPPSESRFCYTVTNAPAYHLAGRITITVRNAALQTFSTTIEGTAAPTRLEVYPGGAIQAAIDAASPGETVLVNPGTYTESLTLRAGINVKGAGAGMVTLRTPTQPGVMIGSCTGTEFSGFTVTPAAGSTATTGIEVSTGSPLVKNNLITGFSRYGLHLYSCTAIVCGNRIQNNGDSGNILIDCGIYSVSSTPLIANNLISGNECGCDIESHLSDGAQFINNTVVGNSVEGLSCSSSSPVVKNNIVAGNPVGIIADFGDATPILTYNNVWNNSTSNYLAQNTGVITIGIGSLSVDPLFLTTAPGDYQLAPTSPCRDTGDPAAIYNDLDGSRNDMGWTGGPCASPEESAAPFGGFLFTSVGNIPANYVGLADGLATVPSGDADALHIPAWDHAAFGSQPWLFGVFGSGVASPQYYMIECKPDGTPDSSFAPLDHPFSKVKFTITPTGITTAVEAVGPVWSGTTPYYRTTTNGGNIYWANDSLRLVLNSPQLTDGIHNFRLKAFGAAFTPITLTGLANGLTLRINNKPPTVSILSIARASGATVSECGIVGLTSDRENLTFRITANHPDGFLDSYLLDVLVGHDRYAGVIASDSHAASHSGQPSWTGITDQAFGTLPAMTAVPPRLASWESCAYQVRLRAWARITNGYSQIHSGTSFWNLALNCRPADLDGDGDVDGDDLNIFADAYGSSGN